MSDIGDMIERGSEGPGWVERASNAALRKRVTGLEAECIRLQAELGHGRDERAKLRAKLADSEALLSTAVDAWECGMMVTGPDGVVLADFKAACLPKAWYDEAKKAGGGS